jgi:hypothetical protein
MVCRLMAIRLIKNQAFYWLVMIIVCLNSIFIAIEYYGQPVWLENFLSRLRYTLFNQSN